MRSVIAVAVLTLGVTPGYETHAQTAPDAGALRQQLDNERRPALPAAAAPLQPGAPAPMTLPEGATVSVNAFRFAGNNLLDSSRLQLLVQPYLGRELGFTELQRAAQAVASAYREAGWVARAFLPAQDVTSGVVTIQVVEATYTGASIEGATESLRPKPSLILSRVNARQKRGDPLSTERLDRGLLLANDLPGVSVSGALVAGEREGETALALRVTDQPLVSGEISADNAGSRATGAERLLAALSLNNPLGAGDQLRLDALHSQGSDYARLAYSLPVGNDGWRLGVNSADFTYRLIAPEFNALNGRGSSRSVGLDATYPLIRSREHNLYLNLAWDDKRLRNEANQTTQSDYRVRSSTLGLSGNQFDELGGGGASNFTLAWTDGRLNQGSPDAGENPALAGRFGKLRYSASRLQALAPALSFYGAVSGQHAGKDLDSGERFYLGGAGGVRAYPASEGSGSRGELANLELRWRGPAALQFTGFYDWGQVTSFSAGTRYALKGYGLAVSWSGPYNLNLKLTWARRDGSNPNPTATGRDQDGSLDLNRWWLQASLPF